MGQCQPSSTKQGLKSERGRTEKQTSDGQVLRHWWRLTDGHWGSGERGIPHVSLLLLGEFQSVAEDLDSRLFKTESTCLGRLTVDTEHLPKKPRERHTVFHTGQMVERKKGKVCGAMPYAQTNKQPSTVENCYLVKWTNHTVSFLCTHSNNTHCFMVQNSICSKPSAKHLHSINTSNAATFVCIWINTHLI